MNKVIMTGRLTKDPELRFTQNKNTPVSSFSIAVDRRFKKQGEEKKADFFQCIAWNKYPGEFISQNFTKGQPIIVVGRLENRSWDDNEGKKRYVTELIVEETYFAGNKPNGGASGGQNSTGNNTSGGGAEQEGFYPMDEDDELPF